MAKKAKLNLDTLKIQSFVTTLNVDEAADIKGGSAYYKCTGTCLTLPQESCPDSEVGCTEPVACD